MRLKLYLLAICVALSSSISAQQYKEDYVITRAGGKNSSSLKMVYAVMTGVTLPRMKETAGKIDINNTAGGQVGFRWGLDLGGLEIVPEIWYQFDKTDIYNNINLNSGQLINNGIEIPVVIGMPLGPIKINVGPSFSVMSDTKYCDNETNEEVDFGRTRSTAGYLFGISTTIKNKFILDLRYTGRFVSVSSEWYNDEQSHEYRYYSLAASVGYRF